MAEAQTVTPSLRQERLAAILADTKNPPKSRADALIRAGYSKATAYGNATRQIELAGTQIAIAEKAASRSDKARGLKAIGDRALSKPELIDTLEPRDRFAVGIQALKTANELGVEQEAGDEDAVRVWKREFLHAVFPRLQRMHVTGVGPLGWRATQHVVLSPSDNAASTEK